MKQITAKQYARLHHFLPVQRGNVRIPNIIFINAILCILKNGCKWRARPKRFGNWFTIYAWFRRWSRSGVLERRFGSSSVQMHPDGIGARKKSGPQSIGKPRGGWNTKIHMVSASDRQAMIFRLSGGPTTRPKAASCWKARTSQSRPRLRGRQDPRPRGDSGDDADHAAEGEPERQMGLRRRVRQAAKRGRTAVPATQGLPAHLHAIRQARRDVHEVPELRVWTPLRHGIFPCPISSVGSSAFVCPAC